MSAKTKATKLFGALLACSALYAAPEAQAQSCSTAAWDGGTVTGTGSAAATRKYSGSCGLSGTLPTGYVTESTNHSAEGVAAPLHVRFFVYPGITSGNVTVFQGMDANSGGNSVIQVHYNAASQRFEFQTPSGTGFTTGTAPSASWYRVMLTYQANQALVATVKGNGGTVYAVSGLPNAGAAGVEAVRLGAVAGTATGTVFVDEYEASRAAGDPGMAPKHRGDANDDGGVSGPDIVLVARQAGGFITNPGQPDCNEDGGVSGPDIICTARIAGGFVAP